MELELRQKSAQLEGARPFYTRAQNALCPQETPAKLHPLAFPSAGLSPLSSSRSAGQLAGQPAGKLANPQAQTTGAPPASAAAKPSPHAGGRPATVRALCCRRSSSSSTSVARRWQDALESSLARQLASSQQPGRGAQTAQTSSGWPLARRAQLQQVKPSI